MWMNYLILCPHSSLNSLIPVTFTPTLFLLLIPVTTSHIWFLVRTTLPLKIWMALIPTHCLLFFHLAYSLALSNPVMAFMKIFRFSPSPLLTVCHSSSVFHFFPIHPTCPASLLDSFSPLSLSCSSVASVLLSLYWGKVIFILSVRFSPVYYTIAL